ncbi:hypothetical protein L323_01600 [Ruminiclostridium papyrosolvens C7]|uniref:Uncharacterized protein n=1 Tax=Ruminiclostridium papyrosolvens C7 TaxID=1330534 RepID=U4R784_9FIRM|nr:hypothetical protein L323_01600 [Ruminiclostridium papyrosolvens C7]
MRSISSKGGVAPPSEQENLLAIYKWHLKN